MLKRTALLMAAACALPLAGPATAFHGETCSAAGASPLAEAAPGTGVYPFYATPTPANGFPYQNPPGTPIKHTVTLAPGKHVVVAAQVGDVDFVFCVPGAAVNRHVCATGNVMPLPESCLLGITGSPGTPPPIVCRGPLPCDYVLYIFYCSGVWCGYPLEVPQTAIAGVIAPW